MDIIRRRGEGLWACLPPFPPLFLPLWAGKEEAVQFHTLGPDSEGPDLNVCQLSLCQWWNMNQSRP